MQEERQGEGLKASRVKSGEIKGRDKMDRKRQRLLGMFPVIDAHLLLTKLILYIRHHVC